MDTNTAPSKYPICRHIKTNGRRCQSPAVHRATFCHFHRTLHDAHTKGFPPPSALGYLPTEHIEKMLSYGEPLSEIAKAFPSPAAWMSVPPPLEDAESVQVAISLIFADMVSGHVSTERARPLLYALQLASYNFRTLAQIQTRDATADPIPMAHRVVRTRKGHTLSAPNDESDSPSLLPAKAPRRRRLTPPALQPAFLSRPIPHSPSPFPSLPLIRSPPSFWRSQNLRICLSLLSANPPKPTPTERPGPAASATAAKITRPKPAPTSRKSPWKRRLWSQSTHQTTATPYFPRGKPHGMTVLAITPMK